MTIYITICYVLHAVCTTYTASYAKNEADYTTIVMIAYSSRSNSTTTGNQTRVNSRNVRLTRRSILLYVR